MSLLDDDAPLMSQSLPGSLETEPDSQDLLQDLLPMEDLFEESLLSDQDLSRGVDAVLDSDASSKAASPPRNKDGSLRKTMGRPKSKPPKRVQPVRIAQNQCFRHLPRWLSGGLGPLPNPQPLAAYTGLW